MNEIAERAVELWRVGDVAAVEPLLRELWQASDATWTPWAGWKLGDLLRERGQIQDAIGILREAVAWDHPEYGAHARNSLGVALAEAGEQDEAERQFQIVASLDRPDVRPTALFNLGLAAQKHGRLPEAVERYRAAVDSDNPEVAAQAGVNLGVVYRALGRSGDALRAFDRVIDSGHPVQSELARRNLDSMRRPWLQRMLVLDVAILVLTVALGLIGDRSPEWSQRLGSLVISWTIMANLIAAGPLRVQWRGVGKLTRIIAAACSLLGTLAVVLGLVTRDPDVITGGAVLIVGAEALAETGRRR